MDKTNLKKLKENIEENFKQENKKPDISFCQLCGIEALEVEFKNIVLTVSAFNFIYLRTVKVDIAENVNEIFDDYYNIRRIIEKEIKNIESKSECLTDKTNQQILVEAIETFGVDVQLGQLQEECAELIAEINRLKRPDRKNRKSFIEELADVEVVMEQIKMVMDISEKEYFEEIKQYKINRLDKYIEKISGN